MEIKEILHKSPSNMWFRNGIHSLLSRARCQIDGALTSFTVCDAYRYFVGHALLLRKK